VPANLFVVNCHNDTEYLEKSVVVGIEHFLSMHNYLGRSNLVPRGRSKIKANRIRHNEFLSGASKNNDNKTAKV
jgi:hypothetical protein